jgi:hypothetical protein
MSSAQERPSGTAGPGTTGSGEPNATGATGVPGQRAGMPGQRGAPPRATGGTGYQEGYREGYRGDREGYRGETAEYGRADDRGMEGRGVAAMAGHVLAATLMILSGLMTIFVGITGIIRGTFFPAVANYTYHFGPFGRGVTDLIIGAVILAAGVCLLMGMMWARVVGVALAVISAVANFLFLPFAPLWSIVVIALNIFIIWALTSHGRRHAA